MGVMNKPILDQYKLSDSNKTKQQKAPKISLTVPADIKMW